MKKKKMFIYMEKRGADFFFIIQICHFYIRDLHDSANF
jgi:hypothetical protein